jgi:hypothetical protein
MEEKEICSRIKGFLSYIASGLAGVHGLGLIIAETIELESVVRHVQTFCPTYLASEDNFQTKKQKAYLVQDETEFLNVTNKQKVNKENPLVLIADSKFTTKTKIDFRAFDGVLYL